MFMSDHSYMMQCLINTNYHFRVIRCPFKGGFSKRTIATLAISIYVLAFCAVIPLIHFASYIQHPDSPDHWFCDTWHRKTFKCLTVLFPFISFIPMTIICTLQVLTFKEIKKSAKQFKEDFCRIRTVRQVSRTFLIVATVFFFLTTPLCVFALIDFWTFLDIPTDVNYNLYNALVFLMASNSCANSLIYGRVHTRLFKCITCNIRNRRIDRTNDLTSRSTYASEKKESPAVIPLPSTPVND